MKKELTYLEKQELEKLTTKASNLQSEISHFKRAGDYERAKELEDEYQTVLDEMDDIRYGCD